MGLNMFANPIITPVIILYNIKSLEFICFNTFENANIDKTIPKLTATTGQQMVHHIQLIGFKSQKQGKIIFIFLLLNEKYKNKYGVPQINDMMVTGVGTLGVCYIVKKEDKFYFKDGNILWFENKGLCNVRFIKDQYNTNFVKEQIVNNANSSTVGTYTITNANNTKVLTPPIYVQNKYVKFCEQIDKSKFIIQKQIKLLEELLEKKMNEYFGD